MNWSLNKQSVIDFITYLDELSFKYISSEYWINEQYRNSVVILF